VIEKGRLTDKGSNGPGIHLWNWARGRGNAESPNRPTRISNIEQGMSKGEGIEKRARNPILPFFSLGVRHSLFDIRYSRWPVCLSFPVGTPRPNGQAYPRAGAPLLQVTPYSASSLRSSASSLRMRGSG